MIAAAPAVPAVLAPCDAPAAARSFTLTVRSDGLNRTARVHVPAKSGGLPVLLVLHFATGTGPAMEKAFGYSKLADRKGFIAVYPTSGHSRGFWNVRGDPAQPDDVQFMRDLLDALPSEVCSNAAARLRHRRLERRQHDRRAGLQDGRPAGRDRAGLGRLHDLRLVPAGAARDGVRRARHGRPGRPVQRRQALHEGVAQAQRLQRDAHRQAHGQCRPLPLALHRARRCRI